MDKCQKGFTLTEMMVVTAIVAILFAIAIPSYKYLTTSYRMSAEINNLVGDLQYARGEALKEGTPVTVCVSSDGATCTGGNNWGWAGSFSPISITMPRRMSASACSRSRPPSPGTTGHLQRQWRCDGGDLQPRGLRLDGGGVRRHDPDA